MPINNRQIGRPGPFTNFPVTIVGESGNVTSGGTGNETHDIRPGKSQLWQLDYCWIEAITFTSPDAGKGLFLRIKATQDGVNFYELKATQILQGATLTAGGTRVEFGGTGSPFLLSNERFIRLSIESNSAGGNEVADYGAIVRVVS